MDNTYHPNDVTGINFGVFVVGVSATLFTLNNLLVLDKIAPARARNSDAQLWKWRNTANSLIHSFVTGCWTLFSFWMIPELRYNILTCYSTSVHILIGVSLGYFFYDLGDMLCNHRKKGTYELALHHIVVIICFGLSLLTRYYQGYTLLSLMVEVNSVFLHIRQLMIVEGWSKHNIWYRINSWLNIGTFIVFRFVTLSWMVRCLIEVRNDIGMNVFILGCLANTSIFIMNLVLFLRIIDKDCRNAPSNQQELSNGTQKVD